MLSLGDNGQLILIQLLHVLIPRQTALLYHFDGASFPSLPILSLHNLAEIAFADFRFDLILVIFEFVHPLEDALFPGGGLGEDGPIRPSRIIAFFEEKFAQIRPQVLTVLPLSSFRRWLEWIKFRCATTAH